MSAATLVHSIPARDLSIRDRRPILLEALEAAARDEAAPAVPDTVRRACGGWLEKEELRDALRAPGLRLTALPLDALPIIS